MPCLKTILSPLYHHLNFGGNQGIKLYLTYRIHHSPINLQISKDGKKELKWFSAREQEDSTTNYNDALEPN